MSWLLYGSYGYTGSLILERAMAEGTEPPILAGRREAPLRAQAERWGLPYRAFPLGDDPAFAARTAAALEGVDTVLHCAGPFSATSAPMVAACLSAGAHYLDVTGEYEVFERVLGQDAAAKRAGVVLLPGVGFDVVPSDCLAAMLAQRLPEACELELAFANEGKPSPGTTKTIVEGLPKGGCVRRDGRLIATSAAHLRKRVSFADRPRLCVAIPWGDVSTAFKSTGIGDITVYMAQPYAVIAGMRALRLARPLLGLPRVQRALKAWVDRNIQGPDASERAGFRTQLWGRVRDRFGASVEGTLSVKGGYGFTVDASLAILERVRAGDVEPGAWTPSLAFGADFVLSLPEVSLSIPA